jgi:sulfonate transport system permease protein
MSAKTITASVAAESNAATAGKKPKASRAANIARGLVIPFLLIALWQYLSTLGPTYAYAFVPLNTIFHSTIELIKTGDLFLHIGASISTALKSLVIGGSIGFLLGSLMALSRIVDALIGPLYHVLRQVPTLGLIPLIGLWFGNTEFSKILIVSLATFEVMTLNTYEGLRSVEKKFLELGKVLTFSRFQLFFRVLLPVALPSITTGLMLAVAFAWLATVGVELLFTVGPGLSVVMERAQLAERMDIVIICVTLIGLLGLAMNQVCVVLSKRLLRWRQTR